MKKLTERQTEIYSMIRSFHGQHGYPPTRQEIGEHFGFNPNAAQCHLNALSAKGYIDVAKNKSRGIQLLAS